MPGLAAASKSGGSPKPDLARFEFDRILGTSARLAVIFIAMCVAVVALQAAHSILVPVAIAIVVGLVFGPIADWLERRGVIPAISGLVAVAILIAVILLSIGMLAVPLSEWVGRVPEIWEKLKTQILDWKAPLEALSAVQDQLTSTLGGGAAMEVSVQDGSGVLNVAMLAPSILGDVLIFLVSFYFYIVTRDSIRISILSLCVTRRIRWRTAHVFREVEGKVSHFLLTVTFLNLCVGTAMTLAAWALGMPSPLLWGAMAAVLNYIPYVGQAVMIATLFAVGLGTAGDLLHVLLPVGAYLVITMIESQFVFPQFIGRAMTMNPFLIFLSIVFWIWAWGPVGSLIAVPSLIILQSLISNIFPAREVGPLRPVRRTASMSDKDVVLANAAKAIREQAKVSEVVKPAEVEVPAPRKKRSSRTPRVRPAIAG